MAGVVFPNYIESERGNAMGRTFLPWIAILTQRMAICIDQAAPTIATEFGNDTHLSITNYVAIIRDGANDHPLIAAPTVASHGIARVQPPLCDPMRDPNVEGRHVSFLQSLVDVANGPTHGICLKGRQVPLDAVAMCPCSRHL